MAYEGTIDLISGIRPKNGGTFPLVDAKDVRVTDDMRLPEALEQAAAGGVSSLVAAYDTSEAGYDAGQLCFYEGSVYQCVTPVAQGAEWDPEDWAETSLEALLDEKLTVEDGAHGKQVVVEGSDGSDSDSSPDTRAYEFSAPGTENDNTVAVLGDFANVAFSGSYNDLADKPVIPPGAEVDTAMSDTSENAVQNKVIKKYIDDLFGDLTYEKIKVNSFSASPNTVEVGSTVSSVTLNWTLSKMPVTLTVAGETETSALSGSKTITGSFTTNQTWPISATDAGSAHNPAHTATGSATLKFLNKAYWGVSAEPQSIDSAFVNGLPTTTTGNSALTTSKARSITVNAGASGSGLYVWYAIPESFGTPVFASGGFTGGFRLAATFEHTNESGYKTSYTVWRSDNDGLGNTTINIS